MVATAAVLVVARTMVQHLPQAAVIHLHPTLQTVEVVEAAPLGPVVIFLVRVELLASRGLALGKRHAGGSNSRLGIVSISKAACSRTLQTGTVVSQDLILMSHGQPAEGPRGVSM